jgi:hypothetical protein
MPTPYAEHLDGRDPIDVLRTSLADYDALMSTFTPARWKASYAPGKWTAGEVMLHVAQWEMIFSVRVRCAVSMPGFVVQPMNQDPFMDVEAPAVDGPTAWTAFRGMRAMNLALAASLSPSKRSTVVQHPERGAIDVNDLLTTLAGHAVHHFKQLQRVP